MKVSEKIKYLSKKAKEVIDGSYCYIEVCFSDDYKEGEHFCTNIVDSSNDEILDAYHFEDSSLMGALSLLEKQLDKELKEKKAPKEVFVGGRKYVLEK